jgi:hypothetical protein
MELGQIRSRDLSSAFHAFQDLDRLFTPVTEPNVPLLRHDDLRAATVPCANKPGLSNPCWLGTWASSRILMSRC